MVFVSTFDNSNYRPAEITPRAEVIPAAYFRDTHPELVTAA